MNPNIPPGVLAAVDQWIAGGPESLSVPLATMHAALAEPNTEVLLAQAATALSDGAIQDPLMCRALVSAYILTLHQLALLQQKTRQ